MQVGPPDMGTAIERDDVDAIGIFQPYLSQVADRLGDDAVEIEGIEPYKQHSLYLATADTVAGRGEEMAAVLDALRGADDPLREQDSEAVAAVSAAMGLDEDLTRTVLDEFDFELQLEESLAEDLAARATWAIEQGSLAADTVVPAYADHLASDVLGATGG